MTYMTKPSSTVKKTPLIEEKCDEEVIEIHPPEYTQEVRVNLTTLVCMTVMAFFVTVVGVTTGFMLYRQYVRSTTVVRYQGYCTIPMIKDVAYFEPNYRVMPLRWSVDPEVQVFSEVPEATTDDEVTNALHEEFDIGQTIEKISLVDNGRTVSFIHDFESNLTGIVDTDRCFTTELDPRLVLTPDMFVLSIESDGAFDVSHVRSVLRAVLPAMQQFASAVRELAQHCANKPTYKLVKEEGVITYNPQENKVVPMTVRKRSVEVPPHDYIHFAGRHVQEIEIINLADLLQHEQAVKGE